jgi:hypothetical protein
MPGLNNGSSGLFSGASGLAIAAAAGAGLYNQWEGLAGGDGGSGPGPGIVTDVEILGDISVGITAPSVLSVPMQTNGTTVRIATSGTALVGAVDKTKITLTVEDDGWDTSGTKIKRTRTIGIREAFYKPYNENTAAYQPNLGEFYFKTTHSMFNQSATWKTTIVSVSFAAGWIAGEPLGLVTGASVTRSDSLPYPPFPMRLMNDAWERYGVGDTVKIDVVPINQFARLKSMVACVEGYTIDGNSNVGTTQRVSAFVNSPMTPIGATNPGLPCPSYRLELPLPTTGTPTYRAEARVIAKPWIGPPQCSSAETVSGEAYSAWGREMPTFDLPTGLPFCFDHNDSHIPIYGVVHHDPASATIASNTNVATVSMAGLCKTKAGAIASGQTYADFATLFTAVRRLNNSAVAVTILSDNGLSTTTYQRPTPHTSIYTANGSISGAVAIMLNVAGSTPGADTGCYSWRVTTSSQTNYPPGNFWAQVESQDGVPNDLCRLRGRNFDGTAPASKNIPCRTRFKGVYFDSVGTPAAADNTVIDGTGDHSSIPTELAAVYSSFHDCKARGVDTAGVFGQLYRVGYRWYIRSDIDGVSSNGMFAVGNTVVTGVCAMVGSKYARTGASSAVTVYMYALMGCRLLNMTLERVGITAIANAPNMAQPLPRNGVVFNVEHKITYATAVTGTLNLGSIPIVDGQGVMNYALIFENTASSTGIHLGADGYTYSIDNFIFAHAATLLKIVDPTTGGARTNINYADIGGILRPKRVKAMYSIFPQYNSKQDSFPSPTLWSSADTWNSTASYFAGAIVENGVNGYQALQNIPQSSGILLSDTAYWFNGGPMGVAYGAQPYRQGNKDWQYHIDCEGNVACGSTAGSSTAPSPASSNWYGIAWEENGDYNQVYNDLFVNRAADDYTPVAAGILADRVPAGMAMAPFDVYGTALLDDGTDYAGPIQP